MKKLFWVILLFFLLTLALSGCGGGDGGNNVGGGGNKGGDTGQTPDNPDQGSTFPPLEPGDTAIYFKTSLGSDSQWLGEYGISLETDYYGIFRYIPEKNSVVEIDRFSSPSYARNSRGPYTIGDNLYIATDTWTCSFDCYEYDIMTNSNRRIFSTSHKTDNHTIVGNKIFYTTDIESLTYWSTTTYFMAVDCDTWESSTLKTDSPDVGGLYTVGNQLYSLKCY